LIGFLGPTALFAALQDRNAAIPRAIVAARAPSLPEVPTLEEAGFKDVGARILVWRSCPAGTPTAVIAYLNAEMARAMADPATRDSCCRPQPSRWRQRRGVRPRGARRFAKYARLAKELSIRIN